MATILNQFSLLHSLTVYAPWKNSELISFYVIKFNRIWLHEWYIRSDFSDYSYVRKFAFLEFNFNTSVSSLSTLYRWIVGILASVKWEGNICRYFKVICPDGPRIIVRKIRLPDLWSQFRTLISVKKRKFGLSSIYLEDNRKVTWKM
jgi:hypothetical protein